MTLYLAEADLEIREYMSDLNPHVVERVTRLVEARDESEAADKLEKALVKSDPYPYGTSVSVRNVSLYPVIR